MFFLTQALSAQSAAAPVEAAVAEDAGVVSGDSVQSQPSFGEQDIDFSSWGSSASAGEPASPSGASSFGIGMYLRMLVVLAAIIAVIIVLFRFVRRAAGMQVAPADDDTFLRHISGVSVGTNKSVQIVTLLDKAYLLGVSDSSVNLIAEVTDKELVGAMNLWSDKRNQVSKPRSFADVLDIFMPHGPRGDRTASRPAASAGDDLFSSANSMDLLDSLKRQASRLSESPDSGFEGGGLR